MSSSPPDDPSPASLDTQAVELSARDYRPVQRLHLREVGPGAEGRTHEARSDRTVVGSHATADVRLEDRTVSRFHCEIRAEGSAFLVHDLGSRNGTHVDGVRVLSAHLRAGQTLTCGTTELRVEVGARPVGVPLSTSQGFGALVGGAPAMRRAFALLERAAATEVPVLLEGETGTGKDLAAESIHRASARAGRPFVVVDCGALPGNLLESELFGHERGAFTGAATRTDGAFGAADGGTLFLDEIGELPLELQPKLLRALEKREIRRVGAAHHRRVDVRVVAATNRNLRREVNEGRFRSDLFYRLAVLEVELPPLRERAEDVPVLAAHLARRADPDAGARLLASPGFVDELKRHAWPGNVRELRNYLERCLALRVRAPLGGERARGVAGDASASNAPVAPAFVDVGVPLKHAREAAVDAFERGYLAALLEAEGGNVRAAARRAEVDRTHLYRLLWKHGLR